MDVSQAIRAFRDDPALAKDGQDQYRALLARSATDMAFRKQLLTNSRAAIAEFAGKNVVDVAPMNVVFIENKADATIVLPDPVESATELSEDELQTVAGGTIVTTIIIAVESAILSAETVSIAYELGKRAS